MLKWRMICAAALCGVAVPGLAQIGPLPTNAGAWITELDYPAAAIRNGDEGKVTFKLNISPDGKVTGCEILGGTAPENLKLLTCELVQKRAQFKPAHGSKGEPARGTFQGTVSWRIPEAGEIPQSGSARGRRISLPPRPILIGDDVQPPEPGTMELVMKIRPNGTVADCTWKPFANSAGSDIPEEILGQICKSFSFAPFADGTTKPRTLRIVTTIEEIENE